VGSVLIYNGADGNRVEIADGIAIAGVRSFDGRTAQRRWNDNSSPDQEFPNPSSVKGSSGTAVGVRDGRQWYHDARILVGHTGSDGVVTFDLKQAVPPLVDVVDLSGYPCSRPEAFQTREILDHGVVGVWPRTGIEEADKWCTANAGAPQVEKRPGEIVFYVHPLNGWQNFWYTLRK
jgi:hypothetical protein